MTGKTHLIGGLALGFTAFNILNLEPTWTETVIWYASCGLGALLPDIDHPNAPIARVFLPISFPLQQIWTHRTITHSLLFSIIVPLICLVFTRNPYIIMGIFMGILSHLLLDSLNPTGIPILYPFNKRKYRIAKVKTGEKAEAPTMILFCIIAFIMAKPLLVWNWISPIFVDWINR